MNPVYQSGLYYIICCFLLVLSSCSEEEMKQRGELRKDCSRTINIAQPVRRVKTADRLHALRQTMVSQVILETIPINAYIVTSSDEHQSVEVDEYDRRREYISGFSGSYGDAIVTIHKAALWTDGRYHLQADEQLSCDWLLFREGHRNIPTRTQWLKQEFPNGARVGVNPKLISEYMWNKLSLEFQGTGLELVALNASLIDLIWPAGERGTKRSKDAFVLDIKFTGKSYSTKVEETRKQIAKLGADAMVVTSLDEVAWLLNIRGRDVPFSPFVRSYVILDMQNIFLYVNPSQLTKNNVMAHLHANAFRQEYGVQIRNYSKIWSDLRTQSQLYTKILIPSHCVYSEGASHAIYEHVFPERRLPRQSPIIYLKAVKNPVEIQGMRLAHIKDAAALCDAFAYIEKRIENQTPDKMLTEMDVAAILNEYRYEQNLSLGNSFRTIVAFGANGAQPHYVPTNESNAIIFDNSTVVLESGGQYYEGTTDVTRTLHFGQPNERQREAFTRVLMGAIQYSTLTFPSNMKMADADALARGPLWDVGLDYMHETGHGVGAFLGVRESPISVQYDLEVSTKQTFKPGYFLSNEPGYYREGYFGVRLENVMEVIEKPWLHHSSGHKFLGFKVATLVPYEPKLLKMDLLSTHHKKWLNSYNEQVRSLVGAELKRQDRMDGFYWMMDKTGYIDEYGGSNIINSQPLLILLTNAVIILWHVL